MTSPCLCLLRRQALKCLATTKPSLLKQAARLYHNYFLSTCVDVAGR